MVRLTAEGLHCKKLYGVYHDRNNHFCPKDSPRLHELSQVRLPGTDGKQVDQETLAGTAHGVLLR